MDLDADEEFARKLQEEFDEETRNIEHQNRNDAILAQKLAADSHDISDSENEDCNEKVESLSEISNVKEVTEKYNEFSANDEDKEQQKKGIKRKICQFGADCYRKNPIHLSEFYHPEKSSSSIENSNESILPSEEIYGYSLNSKKSNYNSRKGFEERLKLSSPFNFFLNKVFSLPATKEDWQTLVFPDLLNPQLGTIIESAQLNFMLDLNFVMKFYKTCVPGKTPVLFMYGQLDGDPKDFQEVTCKKVSMPYQYGVHHSKMMMFHYKEGFRVVVHTANLVPDDWSEKTQGFWVSPLFPRLEAGQSSLLEGESKTGFKRDLTEYLLSYKVSDLNRWSNIIRGHDFSSCRVHFIGSVPGYHTGESRFKFGHMKCRNLIRKGSQWRPKSNLPVIVQCSSIGSLGKDARSWLTSELGASLVGGNETTNSTVNLIYPSEDDVRKSSQGYGGGSCLPYNSNTHERQKWLLDHMHCWRSKRRQRNTSMPHIKTYTRLSADLKEAQYFLVTSSNLSKAAWGQLQKQGTQLFVRSYEAGVLWIPTDVVGTDSFSLAADGETDYLRLPYDIPLAQYPSRAIPWFMNTQKSSPDVFGNKYP